MSGGGAGATTPFAPVPTASAHDAEWKRKLFAILIAFVFGFLLAWFLKKCPEKAPGGGGGAATAMMGGGAGPTVGEVRPRSGKAAARPAVVVVAVAVEH